MTQDTTSGTGRNVVYTLKVVTDPNAKAELQKFKQAVQDAFKDAGPNQQEKRDQTMRGPQINIERMRSQVQQEAQRRQLGLFQPADSSIPNLSSRDRKSLSPLVAANQSFHQDRDNTATDASSDTFPPLFSSSPQASSFNAKPAGNLGAAFSSRLPSPDHSSNDVQHSISAVINALTKLAQSLGTTESRSHRNSLLQRANRDAAFG